MKRRVEKMFSTLDIPIPMVKPVEIPGKQDQQATVNLNFVTHKSADIIFSSKEDIPIQNLKEKDNAENYAQLIFKETVNLNSMAAPRESVEKMGSSKEEDVPIIHQKVKSHPQHSAQPTLEITESLNSTTVVYKSPSFSSPSCSSSSSPSTSSSSLSSSSSTSSSSSCSSRSSSPASQFDDSDVDPDYNLDKEGVTRESTDEYDSNNNQSESKKKYRKRKRNPENWKRNIVKKLRNSGKEYRPLNSKENNDVLVPARRLLPPCQDKCRLNCSTKFTEEERQSIFEKFWDLGDLERQRYYVLNQMQSVQPKYKRIVLDRKKDRSSNKAYYFTQDGLRKQVCFLFFKNTLGISERFIRTVKSKNDNGVLKKESRGGSKNVSEDIKEGMRSHLLSIPAVDSHYTRANTQKKYIEGGKCLTDLFNDYVEACIENGKPYGKIHLYRHLFNYEFNMSFFTPKKDQCLQCTTFRNSNTEEKQQLEPSYRNHIEEKELSRVEKEQDKHKITDLYQVACFDLQAALQVPKGDVSSFYYKSRLNCYNFTVCKLQQQGLGQVDCFFWHEGEGKRGATEIGTCLLEFIKHQSEVANSNGLELVFYSDNCGGQGKNKFIITMYLYAVANYKIKSITHKFLVVGHGQNEGDSSHAVIEKAIKKSLKSGPIYVPAHYSAIIGNARKKGFKFCVHEMCHRDFKDLKHLNKSISNSDFNTNSDTGEKFNFNEICVIKVDSNDLDHFFFKLSYKDEEFSSVEIRKRTTRKRFSNLNEVSLESAYTEAMPISKKKHDDLLSLLKNKSIPMVHHEFYQNLKTEIDEED